MSAIASKFLWVFGTNEAVTAPSQGSPTRGTAQNVLGSTGAGVAFNTHGWGREFSFYVESTDSVYGYQLRTGRTSSGPWAVFSSGSNLSAASTTDAVIVQIPGPFKWLSPRVKAMASTANTIIISMTAGE